MEQPDQLSSEARTILLVDDDVTVREIASEILTMRGYDVIEAPNGHDAGHERT
jgi:CheY-like chemotaxis protein